MPDRRIRPRAAVAVLLGLLAPAVHAYAQAPPPNEPSPQPGAPTEAPPPEPEPVPPAEPSGPSAEELARQNEELKEEIEILREDLEYLEQRVDKVSPITGRVTGYLDVGFFSVAGDGSGIRTDIGYANFPEYETSGIADSWVFMGDPLSVMVNSRGDPANTGESRAITFDAIDARKSTFLINSLNVGLFAEVAERAVFTAKIDFLPRGRDVSNPDGLLLGDYVDVRLAYLEYRLRSKAVKASIFAGKFDSLVGFEYRSQEAPTRIEVTPSLVCRYTCGYPIGVKARLGFADDALVLNAGVLNGTNFSEGFAFHNEIDSNHFKTLAGRLSYRFPFARDFELGVSGTWGAQDNQPSDDVYQWMYGLDVHLQRPDFVFRAEFVHGRAKGLTEAGEARCNLAPCLEFKAAYGLVGYRATNIVMPYLRVDWRDALHESGTDFVYISKLWRATPGIRLTLTENLIIKAEYNVNRELGRIPEFRNDVFTSSLVVKY